MKIYVVVTEHHINGVKTLNANVFQDKTSAEIHLRFEKTQAKTSFPTWNQIDVENGFVVAKNINDNSGYFIECRIFGREVE